MFEALVWEQLDPKQQNTLLARPPMPQSTISTRVKEIIEQVRQHGDQALLSLTRQLDGCQLSDLRIDLAAQLARQPIDAKLSAAIEEAAERIQAFHAAGKPQDFSLSTADGVECASRFLPIDPVGLYIPGGQAPLISSVLMLGIPARLAGCRQIVLCTPPGPDGSIHPGILTAANICGIDTIFSIGGAQAIAAMAYGTQTVTKCAKLFGPGNAWVTEAKQQVACDPNGAALDMPAGPSEVMVIADHTANPDLIALDLLAQAEHGNDSQAILLTDNHALAEAVGRAVQHHQSDLGRKAILTESLQHLRLLVTPNLACAVDLANRYAPEHLLLNCADAPRVSQQITTAGSVFIGPWAAESLGDYCSGPNHVLPTYGYARAYSGLSTADFMRRMTTQTVSAAGLANIGPCAAVLAEAEGLQAHQLAVTRRLDLIAEMEQ